MTIVFLLLPALAADTLAAAAACAARGIRIPIRSRWIMALVSSSILFASMVGGAGIWQFFSDFTCKVFSFTALFLLGIGSLFRSLVQNLLKKLKQGRVMQFHAMGLSFSYTKRLPGKDLIKRQKAFPIPLSLIWRLQL